MRYLFVVLSISAIIYLIIAFSLWDILWANGLGTWSVVDRAGLISLWLFALASGCITYSAFKEQAYRSY